MKRYQIQALDGWNKLNLNENLEFKVSGSSRTIRVEFNTSDKVALYASKTKDFKDEILLVSDEGLFTLITSLSGTTYIRAVSKEKSVSITYKNRAQDHTIQKMSDVKFTGLEMRRTRNPEMERLMHMIKTETSKREQILIDQVERLTKKDEVIENDTGAFPPLKGGNKPSLPPSGVQEDDSGTDTPKIGDSEAKKATADNTQSSNESDGE